MTTITLNTTPQQERIITAYMAQHPEAQIDFLDLILEEIENQKDYEAALKGLAEYQANGEQGYNLTQARELLGL